MQYERLLDNKKVTGRLAATPRASPSSQVREHGNQQRDLSQVRQHGYPEAANPGALRCSVTVYRHRVDLGRLREVPGDFFDV